MANTVEWLNILMKEMKAHGEQHELGLNLSKTKYQKKGPTEEVCSGPDMETYYRNEK